MPRSAEALGVENCKKLCKDTVLFVKQKVTVSNILKYEGENLSHELAVSKKGSVKGSHKKIS